MCYTRACPVCDALVAVVSRCVTKIGVRVVLSLQARGLQAMDSAGVLERMRDRKAQGSSDPIVTLALDGGATHGAALAALEGNAKPRVSTKKDNALSPVWHEDFEFALLLPPPPPKRRGRGAPPPKPAAPVPLPALVVTVDDWDLASGNDFMGRRKIALPAHLADGRPRRRWYPLGDESGRAPPTEDELDDANADDKKREARRRGGGRTSRSSAVTESMPTFQ